jgi:hypothetical protein
MTNWLSELSACLDECGMVYQFHKGVAMAKVIEMKKRRGVQRILQEAANSAEVKAIQRALDNPVVAKKVGRTSDELIDSCHRQAAESFKNRQIADFWDKATAPSKRKASPVASSTTTITEAEFLKIVGRENKSAAANSAWILRRIRHAAAQSDSSLFPAYKQMGRERLYHLESVKEWLACHPF